MKPQFRFNLLGESKKEISSKSVDKFKVSRLKDRMINDLKNSIGGFDKFILYYSKKINNG